MASEKKKVSLRLKFCIMILIVTSLLCVAAVSAAYLIHSGTVNERYKNLSRTVAGTVTGFVKEDHVKAYLNGENSIEYIEVNNKIRHLKNAVPNIQCIGVYVMLPDGMRIIFDTGAEDVKTTLGSQVYYDRSWIEYKDEFLSGKIVENADILVNQGISVMYCTPSGTIDGNNVYVCVGVAESVIKEEKRAFVNYNAVAIGGITFIFLLLALYLFETKITKPVRTICKTVEKAADRADNEFINEIVKTDLRTGNEIENIYKGLLKIYTLKARLFSAVSKADETSVEAIKSLIKRMDNFTASHLDNSLQYVIMMANELRKHDKYKNLITDKDIEDLTLAAPLHDIGKLAIPERIVGKPGRLTDEEYEIMKKHATLGGKLIEEMYLKNSDENYLRLARDIAIYHHERWDGTGYPKGLKGEEIPLFVRIVSIADVFDALVSERVYKPAYSFEESFEIIIKDSGRFFDPEIVDVFVSNKETIREVYKRISNKEQ